MTKLDLYKVINCLCLVPRYIVTPLSCPRKIFKFGSAEKITVPRYTHLRPHAKFEPCQLPKPVVQKGIAVISAKNHKRQRRKRQYVTAKREKSQTPKVLTAILTLPNLT